MKNIFLYTITSLLICTSTISSAQDGRVDTIYTIGHDYHFIFINHIDTNDILSLELLSAFQNGQKTGIKDTTFQIEHKFYKEFYLEFEANNIYKYVYDSLNNYRHYVYTQKFTMPKGGKLALAHCLYSHVIYPKEAHQLKVEGLGFVQAFINEKGCISKVKPLTRIGYGIEREIMKAVVKCGCVYEAGTRNGTAVKSIWNIPMRFKL